MNQGFISFNICTGQWCTENVAQVVRQFGILLSVYSDTTGLFTFKLVEDGDETPDYQVCVSNDGQDLDWNIEDRSATGFSLRISSGGSPYSPLTLCTVTVERLSSP